MPLLLRVSVLMATSLAVADGFVTTHHPTQKAWISYPHPFGVDSRSSLVELNMASIGVFFGTSTGSTEEVADLIAAEFGADAEGPFDVDVEPAMELFGKYDALVVGTPTWNTGAEIERSGTGWDEIYYGPMQELEFLKGKKVAVFGLGDQVSYSENYADASGELHDVFENLGCRMMGYTSQEGYEHDASKAVRGDKFCGLLCDMVNQEDLTEERVQKWVAQLRSEGFLGESAKGGEAVAPPPPSVPSATTSTPPSSATAAPAATPVSAASDRDDIISKLEKENAELRKILEENSVLLDQSIAVHSTGFTPHFNPTTGKNMWTSADGRQSYVTVEGTKPTPSVGP